MVGRRQVQEHREEPEAHHTHGQLHGVLHEHRACLAHAELDVCQERLEQVELRTVFAMR